MKAVAIHFPGRQVRGFQPGDLVVPRVRRPCPHASCPACRHGFPDFCVTGDYTERGIQGAHGFAAEFFVEDVAYLHPVPSALRGVAVLTEPLTIAEKALRGVERVQARLPWKPTSPGRAVVLGKEEQSLETSELMRQVVLRNQVVLGTVNAADRDFDAAIEDLGRFRARWPGGLERLLSGHHPPEAYPQVVREKGGIKHVITFG